MNTPDLAWLRRAVDQFREHGGYLASVAGDVDAVAEEFHITPEQACYLLICLPPRTYEEAQQIAQRVGAQTDDVFHAFVVADR